jgi:phosphoenolpyruvate-protein kinase (PTS system EI component)
MSHVLHGIGAAPGVATAPAWLFRRSSGGRDRASLVQALERRRARIGSPLSRRLRDARRPEESRILQAQALMATDPELLGSAERRMKAGISDSKAILAAGEEQAPALVALNDEVTASA